MSTLRNIFIFITILLFLYIVVNLVNTRNKLIFTLLNQPDTETFVEGYDQVGIDATQINYEDTSYAKDSGITNVNDAVLNQPLREFVIKSSYNTAVSGKFVSLDMIKYVLGRGCRFLDFEVFYSETQKDVFVAQSMDSTYKTIQGDSSLSLVSVFNRVMGSAFNSDSPNPNDPLFIQLRVKSSTAKVFPSIAQDIDNVLKSRIYTKNIDYNTNLKDIMGKIVIVMDKTINDNYYRNNGCTDDGTECKDIKQYINIESGTEYMRMARYSDMLERQTYPPQVKDDNTGTTVQYIQVVIPDINGKTVSNPSFYPFVLKYGSQIILYQFFNKDEQLTIYEDFFKEFNTAFVPLARAIPFLSSENYILQNRER